jgi:hypothetical protein
VLGCGDCASTLATVQVVVFMDNNLNGNLDSEERQQVSYDSGIAIYVDANQDGEYTPNVDSVYYGHSQLLSVLETELILFQDECTSVTNDQEFQEPHQ